MLGASPEISSSPCEADGSPIPGNAAVDDWLVCVPFGSWGPECASLSCLRSKSVRVKAAPQEHTNGFSLVSVDLSGQYALQLIVVKLGMRTGPTMTSQMLWPLKIAATIRANMRIWHLEL